MADNNIASPAWIPAVSALGGVLVGLFGPWLTTFTITKRERESRREARRDAARERQNAFQRETLLQLQDATEKLIRLGERLHNFNRDTHRLTGQWTQGYPENLAVASANTFMSVARLRVRVTDDLIRSICFELQEEFGEVRSSSDGMKQAPVLDKLFQRQERLNDVIGERLRTLDDEAISF